MRSLVALALALGGLSLGQDSRPQLSPVTKTERIDFPAGGTLRLKNSVGELTIEGGDRQDLEITTIKTARDGEGPESREHAATLLEKVNVSMERKGDEVVVTTAVPKRHVLIRPFTGPPGFELEYRIKVPRNARIAVDHHDGEIHIINITGDIQAADRMGQITVSLPQEGQYAIDAKTKIGAIDSDFPGQERRNKLKFGHSFANETGAAKQKLFLRVGFGDITILAARIPPAPPALSRK